MSLLKRLFGGGDAPQASEPETYKDFQIFPEPIKEGGKYRIAARIEKSVDGETKSHHLIRADLLDDETSAVEASVAKAKQMIDEQGDRIF